MAAKSHGTHTDDNHKALWSGRFAEGPDAAAVEFETSIFVDERMALDDIHGSMAHAEMLGACGIISKKESAEIIKGLKSIENDLDIQGYKNIIKSLKERFGGYKVEQVKDDPWGDELVD